MDNENYVNAWNNFKKIVLLGIITVISVLVKMTISLI